MTIGSSKNRLTMRFIRKPVRTSGKAAAVPTRVAPTVVTAVTTMLFRTAPSRTKSSRNSRYQLSVKCWSGNVITAELLNEKTISTAMGR